jgi:hypothetical protein
LQYIGLRKYKQAINNLQKMQEINLDEETWIWPWRAMTNIETAYPVPTLVALVHCQHLHQYSHTRRRTLY